MIWKKCQFLYLKKTFTAPDSASQFLQPSASQVRATLGFILKIRFPSNSIRVLLLPHSNTNNLNSITLNTVVVQCIQFCLKCLHKHDTSFVIFNFFWVFSYYGQSLLYVKCFYGKIHIHTHIHFTFLCSKKELPNSKFRLFFFFFFERIQVL